jgi:hypothetical protein
MEKLISDNNLKNRLVPSSTMNNNPVFNNKEDIQGIKEGIKGNEKIPAYDSKKYTFNGKNYYYLNNDTLAREIQELIQPEQELFNIRLCMFRLNHDCKEPFLQLFAELEEKNGDKNIIFPGGEFPILKSDNEDDMQTKFDQYCLSEFMKITGTNETIAKQCYRGFVTEYDNTIYPLFDCTYIDIAISNDKNNRFWGILDELINEQHVHDYIIDRNIFMMFNHNEFLTDIKDESHMPINLPCCLYLVKRTEDDTDYENVFLDEDRSTTNIVEDTIEHEVFGRYHYFTTDPIDPENPKQLKRFSAFIDNSLYFLNISTPIDGIDLEGDLDDAEEDENVKTHRDYTSIYFFENAKQLWCIKDTTRFIEI